MTSNHFIQVLNDLPFFAYVIFVGICLMGIFIAGHYMAKDDPGLQLPKSI